MKILGISAFYHDAAAALLIDGKITAAAQEERFTRVKHDPRFPGNAILYCLHSQQLKLKDIDHIVFYEKPFLKFERLLETYLAFAPKGFSSFLKALPLWTKEKLFQKSKLIKLLNDLSGNEAAIADKLLFSEHHLSHAASAFYPSPFKEALVLTLDGVGEWTTTSAALASHNEINILKEIKFPHSLGLLYSAFTYFTGFKVNSGEYKLMGLAPYGQPKYVQQILNNLIDVKSDGSFKLNMQYFDYCTGLTMTNQKFADLFGIKPRKSEDKLTSMHMDIAASIQQVTEDILIKMVSSLVMETQQRNLCLAGGVALNCVANGKILQKNIVDDIWIQPAAGDAGGAIGAAYDCYYRHLNNPRSLPNTQDDMSGAYLGPEFTDNEIEIRLKKCGAIFRKLNAAEALEQTSDYLVQQKVIGWFSGRMEFGPRALGNRSIIADPRSEQMQSALNLKIKYRESFRPFAPAVLEEDLSLWFDTTHVSPYMLLVADVNEKNRYQLTEAQQQLFGIEKLKVPRSTVPAITHVNYSARIQTVSKQTNPHFHQLISKFKDKTGCGMLINTSFNVRGEPIVCTPEDAFKCFMGTEMDVLVLGNIILLKEEQNPELKLNYKDSFELD